MSQLISFFSMAFYRAAIWILSQQTLLHGLAGSLAAGISTLLFYPLEQITSMMQAQEDGTALSIVDRLLSQGVFCGFAAHLQTVWISYFAYFALYHALRTQWDSTTWRSSSRLPHAARDLFASSVAGVLSVLASSPFWISATRLRLGCHGHSLWTEVIQIASQEGSLALWNGISSSLVLVLNPVLQFSVCDILKRHRLKAQAYHGRDILHAREAFFIGAGCKSLASFVTYPVQLAQLKSRAGPKHDESCKGLVHCLMYLLQARGLQGWYAGLGGKLLLTVSNAAFMYMCYEQILNSLKSGLSRCAKAGAAMHVHKDRTADIGSEKLKGG